MNASAVFDYQQLFHTGIRVPDIAAAMEELGESLDVTWAAPVHSPGQPVWTPDQGQHELELRFTYSAEGPQHIELLEGPPGSIWSGHEQPGVHHQGVWVPDVAAAVDRCSANGWQCVAASKAPEEGYGTFAYVQPPSGMIVEFVIDLARPRFEQWWAGGTLG